MSRGTPEGCLPSCRGICLLVILTEDLSRTALEWPQVPCLLRSSASRPPVGAGLVAEESKVTPNPEDLRGGCAACWYSVAGRPLGNRGGWQMGGAIWGACGAQACLPRAVPGHPVPMAVGRYGRIVGDSWGTAASKGGMSEMESPGGGGTYPGIPPKEVLGLVTPPEEAVAPYPRVIPIN